jgi:hypothetical protein
VSVPGAPAGLVDRLRSTLAILHQTLPRSGAIAVEPAVMIADRARILDVLSNVLSHLDRQDLDSRRVLSEIVTEYRPQARAAELRKLLLDLQHGWERRIANKLGPQRVSALLRLLDLRVPDFLDILGRVGDENANSDVLAWLLDPCRAPHVAPAALCRLATFLAEPELWSQRLRAAAHAECLSVRREVTIGQEWAEEDTAHRLDLLISGPGFVLAIENKVWAPEHTRQTEGYWRWLSRLPHLHGGLFLSPTGQAPLSVGFRAVSYMDLLGCLLDAPASAERLDCEEEITLASYIKTLAGHVLRTELRAIRATGGFR